MSAGFPQLRVRTEFSFKQAFGPLARCAAALAELGTPAAGIVDGGTWGHVKWAKALRAAGVRPLLGTELTIAQEDGRKPTAWALAEDTKAFYRFSTAARQPDADVAALFAQARGVVRFSGAALNDPECFDYVDINPASALQQRAALALHKRTGRPLVVTSDNAFPAKSDYGAFMALISRERATPQHILSLEELRATLRCLDDSQWAAAVANTHEAAERCASELPTAPVIHIDGDLRALAERGRLSRLERGHLSSWPEEYAARLERELAAIEAKGYESYFLVVADLIEWAKKRMLVGPGRGSSAGSLLCYLVGITEVDPIPHKLLFERFIDLTRKDLPDIDIDFSDTKRDQVFTYLADKYGRENVARIGNINTFKPRSVLAQVCKQFGIPDHERFNLVNVLIEYSSGDSRYGKGLEDTLNNTDIGQAFMARHPKAAVMGVVENHASHTGVHAAGVIVSNVAVTDYCTVGADGVAQIDKPDAEALNLLKIDALGLRTLGVIEDSGVVDAETLFALKLDDPEVFKIFNQHRYGAVFQFEGQSQRTISKQVLVDEFRVVDHLTALARPGPLGGGATGKYIARKAGLEEVTTTHPRLTEMLADTYGVVLYQEQVMQIVREIGKFSWEDTTIIRKAMSGRKGKEFFDQKGAQFVEGAAQDGISAPDAQAIWNEICSFGAWGMNRCTHKNTRIKLAHPNQHLGPDPTIEELYKYYVESPSAWVRQRKAMPVLLCVGEDGAARPTTAVSIVCNGPKVCWRYELTDGKVLECTPDHKFIVDGVWAPIGNAEIGSAISVVARDHASSTPLAGRPLGIRNGRHVAERAFKRQMRGRPCQDCSDLQPRMEAHHNDHNHGALRPADMAWLCSSCHKLRHKAAGDWDSPYARGWVPAPPARLLKKTMIGVHTTYDIEMPDPHHNYVLANGVVTHNSHTCAYAVISYWCAWMKRYHPLEYAAACLRGAKDDDQTIEVLREAAAEGISYVPFDIERSDITWSVVDGVLLGGFTNLHGVGPAKARAAIDARKAGKLDREKFAAMQVKFAELYPLSKQYAGLYEDPEAHGCKAGSVLLKADELPERGEVLYLGMLSEKERRDENETVRVARREGRRVKGPSLFVDLVLRDDTGIPMICRIDRWDYDPLGKRAHEHLVVDKDVLLVRGRRVPNFQMIKVERIKCLTRPEVLSA